MSILGLSDGKYKNSLIKIKNFNNGKIKLYKSYYNMHLKKILETQNTKKKSVKL